MRRTRHCPKCDRQYSPEEVQGLCPYCLRAMLGRLEAAKSHQILKHSDPAILPAPVSNKRRYPTNPLLSLMVMLAMPVLEMRAQVVNDGATNTLSNVTNNFTSDVTVGTNGSFTLLVLSDNTLLTNSANGQIGLNTTAKSNEVRLVSPTARWRMGTSLLVGNSIRIH